MVQRSGKLFILLEASTNLDLLDLTNTNNEGGIQLIYVYAFVGSRD